MLSTFNIIRVAIFAAVLAWTLIVIGLAAHLDQLLIANEYTAFIPLAIFVSACTFVMLPALIVFGFMKRRFLVQQVRVELAFVGLLAGLWLIVGLYTAMEPDTEVECDFDGDGDWVESDEFSTDTYHAQYHTIEAFSLLNAILLIAYLIFVLILAFRQRKSSKSQVWRAPVSSLLGGTSPSETSYPPKTVDDSLESLPKGVTAAKILAQTTTTPMKAGGHYIIYIPPPPPARQ